MRTRAGLLRGTAAGLAAGAAGATMLNLVTYLDMAVRARPASSAPQEVVERLAYRVDVGIPGVGEDRDTRLSALGALSGMVAGLGVGAVVGGIAGLGRRPPLVGGAVAAALGAMLVADGPIAALGISDPRSWRAADWTSDVVPHLTYGLTTVAVVRALTRR